MDEPIFKVESVQDVLVLGSLIMGGAGIAALGLVPTVLGFAYLRFVLGALKDEVLPQFKEVRQTNLKKRGKL